VFSASQMTLPLCRAGPVRSTAPAVFFTAIDRTIESKFTKIAPAAQTRSKKSRIAILLNPL
jgi:hypothetical protein